MVAASRPEARDALARDVAVATRSGYPLIYLVTREERRVLDSVARAAKAGRQSLRRWSVSRGLDGAADEATRDPAVALDAIAGVREPALFVFLDLHLHLDGPEVRRKLRDRLEELAARQQSVVIVAPRLALPPGLEADAAIFDVPLPGAALLRGALERVAGERQLALDPDRAERAVRAALGLTLDQAERTFRKVIGLGGGLEESDLARVVAEKKALLARTDALEFHDLRERLTEVGGLSELKRWLAARSRAFGEDARQFGLPPPKGLLLLGVQGCGKSLSAKAVAELWKFPLLRLDLSMVFSGGVASPEVSLRDATKIAESLAPVVLWIDEIEKGFHGVEGSDGSSRVFGSFITWLAEKSAEVFVVATANDVSALPPELLRRGRFDEVFFVDLPSPAERREVLEIHLKKRGRDPAAFAGLDEIVARSEHFSGAELEQVVVSGLYRAFSAQRELNDEDLSVAVQQTVPLYATYEERIKELRDWAKRRARPASRDASVLDLFGAR